MRTLLLTGSALFLSGYASLAVAQTAPASTAEVESAGLEEIVVTAQRREENLQRAGIAIDVVTGDAFVSKGITSTSDLGKLVPSLNVQTGGGASAIFFLRGVGNFTLNGYSDPAIAFNYDGVYLGRPTSTSGMFYDMERLEVLKGPQGTLYGRNATAGAINVIPTRPKLGEFSGFVNGSYGNYNAMSLQGAINAPLGTATAVRVAGSIVNHDGYLSDDTSDEDNQSLRAQLLTELSSDLSLRIGADYSKTGGKGAGSVYSGAYAFNFPTQRYSFVPSGLEASTGLFDPASQAYRQTLFAGLSGRTLTPLDNDIYQDNRFVGANAELTWTTGAGTLTVIPAWRKSDLDYKFGVPAFIGYIQEQDKQSSLEARFAGPTSGKFNYMLGGFYYDETVDGNYTFAQQALNAYQEFDSDTKSAALFGRLTAHVTDRLRLIGGARYTEDKKNFAGQADVLIVRCVVVVAGRPSCPTVPLLPVTDSFTQLQPPFVVPGAGQPPTPIGATGAILIRAPTVVNTDLKTNKVTYRVATEFDLATDSLLYASFENGYRSGGFALSAGYETFQPEYIDAYTLGIKNRLFNNRLQLNLEIFVWKYLDQQINHTGVDKNGNQGQFTENVGRSTNQGAELDVQYLATDHTLLGVTAQYLDTTYDDFTYQEPVGATPPLTGCPYLVSAGNPALYDINCSGKPAYQSPKWTINLGAQQTIPLGAFKVVAAVDTQYKTSRYLAFQYLPDQLQDANWTSNAQVSFGSDDDRWSVSGYVRNIEDEDVAAAQQLFNAAASATYIPAAPRTYGVRAGIKF